MFAEGQDDGLWPLQGDEGQEDGKDDTHVANFKCSLMDQT